MVFCIVFLEAKTRYTKIMTMIGVLDCNNFFVSCERLFRPDLIDKPVVVLSSNDGCVVARSKEIKDNGIPMGVPYFQIKDILKEVNATVFSSHLALYRDISRRVFEVVSEEVENIEIYSIDECFFTVQETEAEEVAKKIKKIVEKKIGIPVTVGVSFSKTQAKYVNSQAKKTEGVLVCKSEDWQKQVATINLRDIWGVGANRSRQFSKAGITTVKALCDLPASTVVDMFGIEGVRLRSELLGNIVNTVIANKPEQKSVMSTRSFSATSNDLAVLNDALLYHVHQGVEDLEKMGLLAGGLRVMIYPSRYSDYALQGASLEVKFTHPTKNLFIITESALKLLNKAYKNEVPYKKVGICLFDLVHPNSVSLPLFVDDVTKKQENTEILSKTIFDLNKRYGKSLIQVGRISKFENKWQSKKNLLSPAYTTQWSKLKTVRA